MRGNNLNADHTMYAPDILTPRPPAPEDCDGFAKSKNMCRINTFKSKCDIPVCVKVNMTCVELKVNMIYVYNYHIFQAWKH